MKAKKLLACLMAIIMAIGIIPIADLSLQASAKTESEFAAKIAELKTIYRDGEYWNNYNSVGYNGTGTTKCPCTYSCPASCSCKCGKFYLNGTYYGGQCFGFANKMGYLIFGSVPTASWTKYTSVTNYYAGDYVRVRNDKHSIFITKVEGDTITYVDCNNSGACQVKWDRTISKASLKSITTYVYHLSSNTLTGTGTGSSQPSTPENAVVWTVDSKYTTPIKTYPVATSGVITLYNDNLTAYSTSTRNIAYNDLCTINKVYTNGYCSVTYPTSSGPNTEYAKLSSFVSGSVTPYSWKPSSNMNVYMRSNLSEVFGTVYSTDSCTVVGESGNKLQIIYPISDGYKMGWVDSTSTQVTPEPERPSTIIPGPVASGVFSGKSIVAVAPNKITLSSNPVAYISAGDICIIKNVNPSTGYCDVTYPSGGSDVFSGSVTKKTVTIPINHFINYNGSAQAETAKIPYKLTAYPTSSMSHTVGSYTSNWWLDPGDTYTTINNINGNTEVLYYCSQGAHATYWKLGWVQLGYYSLDLNGYLDNVSQGGLMSYGTADIYINGIQRANDVTDFYSANGTYPAGSTYEIKDIRPYKGYTYNGVYSGSASGTLTSNVSVSLKFTKNPVTVEGITVTSNPTKTTYLEGESLNTSGLVVTANYSDGTNKNVTASCSFSGYSSTPGDKTVKVTYSGKTTAFTVTVKSKSPTSISITSLPSKTTYCVGQTISSSGLAVKATYDNGTSATVTDYDVLYDYGITNTAGTKSIKVSYVYNNVQKTTSFNITVQAHSYTSTVTTAATCTTAGVRTYKCSKCSHSYTESIAALGHNWAAATCTAAKTCSRCKATSGSALGHSYTSTVTKAATCTAAGVKTYTCSRCSHSYTESIAALGHSWTAASCTAAKTCSRCKLTEGSALGHSYTSKVTKEETCTVAGVKTYTCSRCSHSYTESIAAAGHKWTAATCTAAKTCSVCKATDGSALGHNYTSKVTKEATCTAAGVKTYTCSRCSHSYTESIAALGHSWTAASCTAAKTCSVCKVTSGEALGHNYTSKVTTVATCEKAGVKTYTCSRCSSSYTEAIPATGHKFVNGICSACGEIIPPDAATITVSSASATAGNQVKVAISLKNNPGITSMLLKVNYDTSKLQLVNVEDKGNLGAAVHSNVMNSPFTLSWANDTATTNYTYNGDIAVLTFNVKEGAEIGETPITVTYKPANYDIIDKDMNSVEFAVINGNVNIIDVIIGDVNNDGSVNTLDRVILTRYIANWEEYPEGSINMTAADVNGDGTVNTLDRVILTRYIANWSGYESLPYNN